MSNDDKTVFVNYDKIISNSTLDQAYMELGKAYYEGKFEDPLPQLLPLFDKITRIKKEEGGDYIVCPECGKQLSKTAAFCGQCGCRIR
ncbi:zinc ribbon domain-containing protein [Faecalicatena contorta]|uniref:zinc ribbon domain-containing protein n=1 Tax=Faecalicatena contorta TaxID=39482 RepID=UPI001F2E3419|nr:zinc ribbon domain-containing protein [Faecalicatena contorta]MCF2682735.1 zinc ribbon domain-containing protein [Faecalicatena contorta]